MKAKPEVVTTSLLLYMCIDYRNLWRFMQTSSSEKEDKMVANFMQIILFLRLLIAMLSYLNLLTASLHFGQEQR